MMQTILKNPLKQELFMMWVEAERLGTVGGDPAMSKLYSILTPVFTSPEYVVTEEDYNQYITTAAELGFFTVGSTEVDEVLDTKIEPL